MNNKKPKKDLIDVSKLDLNSPGVKNFLRVSTEMLLYAAEIYAKEQQKGQNTQETKNDVNYKGPI